MIADTGWKFQSAPRERGEREQTWDAFAVAVVSIRAPRAGRKFLYSL